MSPIRPVPSCWGLTVGCARCHNHKYDRITQADYYRLQSFYAGTKWVDTQLPAGSDDPAYIAEDGCAPRAATRGLRANNCTLSAKVTAPLPSPKNRGRRRTALPSTSIQGRWRDRQVSEGWRQAESRYTELKMRFTQPRKPDRPLCEPSAEAISEDSKTGVTVEHILLRGNLATPGPEVQPWICGGPRRWRRESLLR